MAKTANLELNINPIRRTKTGGMAQIPDRLAVITCSSYTGALNVIRNERAFLLPLQPGFASQIELKNGKICIPGRLGPLPESEVMKHEDISCYRKIDLNLLRLIYTIFLKEHEKDGFARSSVQVTVYLPDLLRRLGFKSRWNQGQINSVVEELARYKDVLGVTGSTSKASGGYSYYRLLESRYDADSNTVTLDSPYFSTLIGFIRDESLKKDEKRPGPTHSYLVSPEIGRDRNREAVENVIIIIRLIEQAGGRGAHISAKNLIDKNALLGMRMEKCQQKNRQSVLDKTFAKTWALLRDCTAVETAYLDIELPQAGAPGSVPNYRRPEETVFEFHHKGKKNRKNDRKDEK